MRLVPAMILLALAGRLTAYSSSMPWIEGTRPAETVPYRECDLELFGGASPSHRGLAGMELRYGVTDTWMVSGFGGYRQDQDPLLGLSVQWNLGAGLQPDLGLFLGLMSGAPAAVGLVMAEHFGEHDVAVNLALELPGSTGWDLLQWDLAYRSPYFYWASRAGLEIQGSMVGQGRITPQLEFMLPGDLALRIGMPVELSSSSVGWTLRLSYELFPSP